MARTENTDMWISEEWADIMELKETSENQIPHLYIWQFLQNYIEK